MGEPTSPFATNRAALLILYALAAMPPGGATYRGLAYAMGISSERAILRSVGAAEELHLVRVLSLGKGRGAKVVIQIDEIGRVLLGQLKAENG